MWSGVGAYAVLTHRVGIIDGFFKPKAGDRCEGNACGSEGGVVYTAVYLAVPNAKGLGGDIQGQVQRVIKESNGVAGAMSNRGRSVGNQPCWRYTH